MRLFPRTTLGVCFTAVWLCAQPVLMREGPWWVERTGGTVPAPGAPFLRIEVPGDVVFKGDGGSSLGYQVTRRVMARGEEEARAFFASLPVAPVWKGDQLSLSLPSRTVARMQVDVRVQPPRQLRQVVVESEDGDVAVRDVRAPVNVFSTAGSVICDRIQGSVSVRTGGGEVILGAIHGAIMARTGGGGMRLRQALSSATLETGGGEILVEEVAGALAAMTGAGNIEVGRAGSAVQVRTRGGLIRIDRAAGEVVAESAGGGILIGHAKSVRCESAAGAVKLAGMTGRVEVSTTVGSILADLLSTRPLLNSLLSAARGDITVWIPGGLAVTVNAVADSPRSRIVSDFAEIPVRESWQGGEARLTARGSLNGGGPVLRVAAGEGVVYLRRRE
ncbi:MAG: hypothetical protein FJW31_10390 [Acidobacteria bacterium]|nr:hypothetical protein [Acidobacteriota bacterium]